MEDDVVIRPLVATDREAVLARLTIGVARWRDPAAAQSAARGWLEPRPASNARAMTDMSSATNMHVQRRSNSGSTDGRADVPIAEPGR